MDPGRASGQQNAVHSGRVSVAATLDAVGFQNDAEEAVSLYNKLENSVVPLYRDAPEKWARMMRTTLAFNGSYFNTNRMVKQYTRNAYYPVKLIEQVKVEEPAFAN